MLPVERVDIGLSDRPHPFEHGLAAAIDANWEAERAAMPALFDGEVVLLSRLVLSGSTLAGTAHVVRYRTFLYWRRHRPVADVAHVFAHAMPVSADNALIAIRMGTATANPGSVYFAAGSFEPADFVAGRVDPDANMCREVGEETGLQLTRMPCDPHFVLFASDRGTVLARRYFLPDTAADIAASIAKNVARQPEPEIAGPVLIRGPDDRPNGLMPHMTPLIAWHFEQSR